MSLAGLALAISPFYASTIQHFFSYSVLCDTIALSLTVVLVVFVAVAWNQHKRKWMKKFSTPLQSEENDEFLI